MAATAGTVRPTGPLAGLRGSKYFDLGVAAVMVTLAALFPLLFPPSDTVTQIGTQALAYTVMALGLNIIVGFAGLLDLGYVAFYAFGAYSMGWFASEFISEVNGGKGIHVLVSDFVKNLPGIHLNFLLVMVAAVIICAIVGVIIGLPTLRLRGDYIAIVTLAFGEIISITAENGDRLKPFGQPITNGKQDLAPDLIDLPLIAPFELLNLRPWYWLALALVLVVLFVNFRLRDSRLGRAWIALREDEVAAASMGVPLVKTKLMAYATGAAFGGIAGAFLGSFNTTVNADQFEFSFSILILAMVILGGLGSIWGVVLGSVSLSIITFYLIPEVFNTLPNDLFGLDFDLTELNAAFFGFLLVVMMVTRPEGLLPEKRRKMELEEGVGTDEAVYESRQS